jgi:hypothetical protein|tara:strand:+ start:1427 stop:1660 length:234 start_codon:yes stop_codon:yes gene_type:complete
MANKIKLGTVIQHKATNRLAKVTDIYYPPDNPFVISLTYKYIETDKGRSMVNIDLDLFADKWDVLDTESKEIESNPV